MCLDEASDAKMKVWGSEMRAGRSDCAEQKVSRRLDGGWDFHAVCNMGESGTITSDGQATGDFGSHYTVTLTSVTSGSAYPQANGERKTTIEAAWKGPCPADMKGGDMELPGGMKINMLSPPRTSTSVKIIEKYDANHMPSQADIARLRAQAEAMKKQMKDAQQ